ncbi:MAG: hypothetical protein ACREQQ_16925, partial [Candidatus Binatia bacterium]
YNDAKFKSFPNAPAPVGSGQTNQDLSGRRMPFVSEIQSNVTPALRFPVVDLVPVPAFVPRDLAVTAALDVIYRSNLYLDSDLDPRSRQDEYVMLDGRVRFTTFDGALSLAVLVDNILDEDVFELAVDSLLFPGGFRVLQEFQRTYGVEMRYSF